jgi:hypothetical protein
MVEPVNISTGQCYPISVTITFIRSSFIDRESTDTAEQLQICQSSEEQSSHYFQGTGLLVPLMATADNEKDKLCDVGNTSAVPSKRRHTDDLIQDFSPMQKAKMRTDENFKQILSNYEDEFTCPMFVYALPVSMLRFYSLTVELQMLRHFVCCTLPSLGGKTEHVFSVASHVGNPCGHTFCGPCGWQWHVKDVSWLANFGDND